MRTKSLLFSTLLIILVPFAGPSLAQSQELTTFILVRHAEKADDTRNPDLSEEGRQRAVQLAELLKNVEITAIYSTPFNRTRQTVRPIATRKNLAVQVYDPYDQTFLDRFLRREGGGVALIAAHSNTTPSLVNTLIGEDKYAKLDESDYSNLFVVTVTEKGEGKVVHLTY